MSIANELEGLAEDTRPTSQHDRVLKALSIAIRYGQIDGSHHKAWTIDQMVRELTGPDYEAVIAYANRGEDGPTTYSWDEGIAP